MKFCVYTWQKMSQKTKDQLTDTAQNFFHLLEQFAKLKNTHCMNVLILENSIQDIISPNFSYIFIKTYLIQTKKLNSKSSNSE